MDTFAYSLRYCLRLWSLSLSFLRKFLRSKFIYKVFKSLFLDSNFDDDNYHLNISQAQREQFVLRESGTSSNCQKIMHMPHRTSVNKSEFLFNPLIIWRWKWIWGCDKMTFHTKSSLTCVWLIFWIWSHSIDDHAVDYDFGVNELNSMAFDDH